MKKIVSAIIIASVATLISCGGNGKNNDQAISADSLNNKKDSIQEAPAPAIPTIKIGEQDWMNADLSISQYNNGDPITQAKTIKEWAACGKKKEGCFYKMKNGTFMYNQYAIADARGIMPVGFAVPTYLDFEKLAKQLGGGSTTDGKATQAMVSYSFSIEDWVGDTETGGLEEIKVSGKGSNGFNAKKGGFISTENSDINEGDCSYWWTSTSEGQNWLVYDIGYCSQYMGGGKTNASSDCGFAVRGIKK
jgi:uncharacterized protein (TIGR02145 family)